MNPDQIRWAPKPPKRRIQVYSVRPGETIRVIAAGPVCGVLTHWNGQASIPCMCPSEAHEPFGGQVPDWRGYLPAYWTNGRPVIVEVTEGAMQAHPELLHVQLTGRWVKLWRKPGRKTNPVFIEVPEDLYRALEVLPYDPKPRLLEMWGLKPADPEPEKGGDDAPAQDF